MALLYLAAYPHASNRQIATEIGIDDDGQISRLLARMQDLGLIRNRTDAHNAGAPNAWELTADGRHLVEAISSAEPPV